MTLLERHDKNAVAYLKMNAPEKLNALSEAMLAALQMSSQPFAGPIHPRCGPLWCGQSLLCRT